MTASGADGGKSLSRQRRHVTMQHTEESIQRLARVQYDTYCMGQKAVNLVFAVILLLMGAMNLFDTAMSLVLLALGCWSLMSLNAPANRNAKKMIEYAKGNLPASEYEFREDGVVIAGDGTETRLKYGDIYSLICDNEYLYLFISRASAYMLPAGGEEGAELKAFVTERCGLPIERPGSLLRFNRKAAARSFAQRRKKT